MFVWHGARVDSPPQNNFTFNSNLFRKFILRIPKGFHHSAQRLRGTSYPGLNAKNNMSNPNGVASPFAPHGFNPFRVDEAQRLSPG